jgi:hypothetical protein
MEQPRRRRYVGPMTAKEALLQAVLDLEESEAASARIVVEHSEPEDDEAELRSLARASTRGALRMMDAEEEAAGFGPWQR